MYERVGRIKTSQNTSVKYNHIIVSLEMVWKGWEGKKKKIKAKESSVIEVKLSKGNRKYLNKEIKK